MTTTAPNAGIPAGLRREALDALPEGQGKGAAGVLFVAPDGDILLCRRSKAEKNFGGHWGLPGGGAEQGEDAETAARREVGEEIGLTSNFPMKMVDRRITPTGVTFTTFVAPVEQKFFPKLNDEHCGFAWAPLDQLPRPIHPGVMNTLKERIGVTEDMTPEDWGGLRDGLMKWISEEEVEPEHREITATDSALKLALDRDSVREKDRSGRLFVAKTNLTKADVNPYYGHEIPGYEQLGLDPNKIYQMYRPAEEIEKAAATSNGVQLLRKHIPVDANDSQPYEVVGAVGTNAQFEHPYLTNSLKVWTADAIDGIESNDKRELSCGYHYRPDMTPGVFDGKPFDGVMRDIVFNHVALVEDGRAGSDVVVGDSMENLTMKTNAQAAIVRTLTVGTMVRALKPKLAMDKKIDVATVFKGITPKGFKAAVPQVIERLKPQLAQDADLAEVGKIITALADAEGVSGVDESVSEEQHNAMEAAAEGNSNLDIPQEVGAEFVKKDDEAGGFDAEPLRAFLKERGVSDEDIESAISMLPNPAVGGADEKPDDPKKDDKPVVAKDEDKPKDKDEKMKDVITKPAMDAAIKAAVDSVRKTEQEIRSAIDDVRGHVGDLPASMAFDSGAAVYRHALDMLGVANKDIHDSALKTVLSLTPKPGAHQPAPSLAMDSKARDDLEAAFPELSRITVVG